MPAAGGTWVWSGNGVFGNSFFPGTLGPHVITLCYTDPFGCTTCVTNTINVINCCIPYCQDFNNNQPNGWLPDPDAPNLTIGLSNAGSLNGPGDYYLETTSELGASALLAPAYYYQWCCGRLCYDYRIINDGDINSSYSVNPVVWVYSGTLGFAYTSVVSATELNGWHHICVPVNNCNQPPPGSTSAGSWQPIQGTAMADWSTVTNNITKVLFRTDYSTVVGERTAIDNVCFIPDAPIAIDAGPDQTICSGQYAALNVTGCNS